MQCKFRVPSQIKEFNLLSFKPFMLQARFYSFQVTKERSLTRNEPEHFFFRRRQFVNYARNENDMNFCRNTKLLNFKVGGFLIIFEKFLLFPDKLLVAGSKDDVWAWENDCGPVLRFQNVHKRPELWQILKFSKQLHEYKFPRHSVQTWWWQKKNKSMFCV